jgi:hypothetical protein
MLSAIAVWRDRWWGWILGVIFSILGGLLGLAFLRASHPMGSVGAALLVIWCLCLLFLGLSAGHFRRQRVG